MSPRFTLAVILLAASAWAPTTAAVPELGPVVPCYNGMDVYVYAACETAGPKAGGGNQWRFDIFVPHEGRDIFAYLRGYDMHSFELTLTEPSGYTCSTRLPVDEAYVDSYTCHEARASPSGSWYALNVIDGNGDMAQKGSFAIVIVLV